MDEDDLYDEPKSGLHGLFVVLFYISLVLLGIATVFMVLNWLDDFLHAPIGIKDYPPEPGLVVLFAKFTWIPFLLSVLLLGFLSFMSRSLRTVPLLLGTVIVVCGGISLVGGILGDSDKQFFTSQEFFTHTLTPILYILFLMAWVGVGANHCIVKWKRDGKTRHGIAALCLVIGLFLALIGLYGLAQNSEPLTLFLMWGLLMASLGFVIYNANYIIGRPQ